MEPKRSGYMVIRGLLEGLMVASCEGGEGGGEGGGSEEGKTSSTGPRV